MKLKFISISIAYFGSFRKPQVLMLNDDPGLNYISGANLVEPRLGANGVGKSTIWAALTWCLFGRTPEGLRGTDIRRWQSNRQTVVTVNFERGKPYSLTRTARPNSMKLNGRDVGQSTIDDLLGLGLDTFLHTVVMAQGQPLFLDLTPGQKLAVITSALVLDRWDTRSAKASEHAAERERLLAETERDIQNREGAVAQTKRLMVNVKKDMELWDRENTGAKDKVKTELQEATARRNKLKLRYGKISVDFDMVEVEARDLSKPFEKTRMKLSKARETLLKAEGRWKADARERDRITRALSGEDRHCPVCGQSLDREARLAMRKRLKQLEAVVEQGVPDELSEEVDAQQSKLKILQETETRLLTRIRTLRPKIDYLTPALAEANAMVDSLNARLNSMDIENPHRMTYMDQRKAIRRGEAALLELNKVRRVTENYIERYRYWVKGFKDVQLYIIEEVLHELNELMPIYLDDMGLSEWRMKFAVEKESKSGSVTRGINVTVLSRDNKEWVRWECWSGGERQRLRLCASLALSEVLLSRASVEVNMEALDEPTRHLSREGVKDMVAFLATRAKDIRRLTFYSDHQTTESTKFSKVITVSKTRFGSKLQ